MNTTAAQSQPPQEVSGDGSAPRSWRGPTAGDSPRGSQRFARSSRLLKHRDFQEVYKDGKRIFSKHITVFYLLRKSCSAKATGASSARANASPPGAVGLKTSTGEISTTKSLQNLQPLPPHPRVGITVGRALGPAVERNRIKRRLRSAIRLSANEFDSALPLDVVINPKRVVFEMPFADLQTEVADAFQKINKHFQK